MNMLNSKRGIDLPFKALSIFWVFFVSHSAFAQSVCFNKTETTQIISSISNPKSVQLNKKLRKKLLEMGTFRKRIEQRLSIFGENKKLIKNRAKTNKKQIIKLCQIYKKHGWLNRDLVGNEGFEAALYLIRNAHIDGINREFLPILIAASKAKKIKKDIVATFIDSIRIKSGVPQIFGTYITVRNEIAYLYPLLNEKKVDEWRKSYDLPTLNTSMRSVENRYLTFVVKLHLAKPPQLTKRASSDLRKEEGTSWTGMVTRMRSLKLILDW